jgi:hypothetical protein
MEWKEDVRRQLVIRQYSPNTQRSYLNALHLFGQYFANQNLRQLTHIEIEGTCFIWQSSGITVFQG